MTPKSPFQSHFEIDINPSRELLCCRSTTTSTCNPIAAL